MTNKPGASIQTIGGTTVTRYSGPAWIVLTTVAILVTFEFGTSEHVHVHHDTTGHVQGLRVLPVPVVLVSSDNNELETTNDNEASAWKQMKMDTESDFRPGLEKTRLPLQMDVYVSKFLADEAPHSIERYQMEAIGDTDLETSQWQLRDDGHGPGTFTREIKYVHAISNPMAPPKARATKQQHMRKYGKHGILIETETVVNDVPKTDCFVVQDRILLEPTQEGGGVHVSAWFNIRFTKKTIFKSIIAKATEGEFGDWFNGYGEMIKMATMMSMSSERMVKQVLTLTGGDQELQQESYMSQSRLPWLSYITRQTY